MPLLGLDPTTFNTSMHRLAKSLSGLKLGLNSERKKERKKKKRRKNSCICCQWIVFTRKQFCYEVKNASVRNNCPVIDFFVVTASVRCAMYFVFNTT
jgi:hypothetical protein